MSYTITQTKPGIEPVTELKAKAALEMARTLTAQGLKEGRDFKITGPSGKIEMYYLERALEGSPPSSRP